MTRAECNFHCYPYGPAPSRSRGITLRIRFDGDSPFIVGRGELCEIMDDGTRAKLIALRPGQSFSEAGVSVSRLA